MKSWIKILSLISVLALEGIVIILDIPELNLIAGALLLITVLIAYTFIAELWDQEKEVRTTKTKAVPGELREFIPGGFAAADRRAAGGEPMPDPGKKRRFPFFSARKNVPEGDMPVPDPGKGSRFPTFSAMMQGLKSLRQGFRTSAGQKERTGGDTLEDATHQGVPGKAGITLASISADATAPVPLKQDPSPFSPLVKESGLHAEFIPSGKEREVSAGLDDTGFDENFADIEIPAPETAAPADISADDETPLMFDDDNGEVSPAFPDTFPEGSGSPGKEGETSLDDELESLDHLDLDTVGLEPGKVAPGSGPAAAEKEQGLAKKVIDSDVREEYMSQFSSESERDTDLLSSLKSDMQGSRKRVNSSLIRDMKDIKIHVHDIEEELISFLQAK